MSPAVAPIVLLVLSNVFMTVAWYGHLKHRETTLVAAVLVSWGIAFFEYCLQVPANRIGYGAGYTASQLKSMQEAITVVVFVAFAWGYLGEAPRWNTLLGLGLIGAGGILVFAPWSSAGG